MAVDLLHRAPQRSPLTKLELEREARIAENRKRMGEWAHGRRHAAVRGSERLAKWMSTPRPPRATTAANPTPVCPPLTPANRTAPTPSPSPSAEEMGVLETARNLMAAINARKPQRTFKPKQPRVCRTAQGHPPQRPPQRRTQPLPCPPCLPAAACTLTCPL